MRLRKCNIHVVHKLVHKVVHKVVHKLVHRVEYLGILLIVVLLGSDPSSDEVIPHSVSESVIVIT